MSQWVIKGLKTGIKTTRYPANDEVRPGVSPGLPKRKRFGDEELVGPILARCPTGALKYVNGEIAVNYRRCIHSYRCVRGINNPLDWQQGYEWAGFAEPASSEHQLGRAFRRSVHILVVDAGDCGACLNEVKQLNNPYYNMHRLGFFLTPTPRHADVMLVVGPVTDQMRLPLRKAYEAMPTPKRVIAAGACAISGGIFGPSFICSAGAAETVPVDIEIPGNPPPPLAILHGLLVAVGRRPPASLGAQGN
jgi:Ni,Fe-hydrogenase III small subunit/uncharacterized Fe-S cluster protein YjdI